MANINKANRTCCDVDIRVLKTLEPYLFFEDANVTTFGFTADETYATSKGEPTHPKILKVLNRLLMTWLQHGLMEKALSMDLQKKMLI